MDSDSSVESSQNEVAASSGSASNSVGSSGADNCEKTEQAQQSRRQFTRAAITGSAVLFSLGNKGAWAAQVESCISTDVYASVVTADPSAVSRNGDEVNAWLELYNENASKPNGVRNPNFDVDELGPVPNAEQQMCYEYNDSR
jgi:hypothetical protein